ncbi:hypothetical protein LTS18_013506 [Coniosporium uncinatum]|uniref:Uncharacterized protein n=1 Tax=Coniosporium uncinatum TaxID=93489 RepID=A0ACC3D954_9PEZI|nr:hypothetical protein LTS18_013506 [Coniosporium uncinatum]
MANEPTDLNKRAQSLIDIYAVARHCQCGPLQNQAIDEVFDTLSGSGLDPAPNLINYALTKTPAASNLCEMMVHLKAQNWNPADINGGRDDESNDTISMEDLPSKVLVKMLAISRKYPIPVRATSSMLQKWDRDWCVYHMHDNDEEAEHCLKRRQQRRAGQRSTTSEPHIDSGFVDAEPDKRAAGDNVRAASRVQAKPEKEPEAPIASPECSIFARCRPRCFGAPLKKSVQNIVQMTAKTSGRRRIIVPGTDEEDSDAGSSLVGFGELDKWTSQY